MLTFSILEGLGKTHAAQTANGGVRLTAGALMTGPPEASVLLSTNKSIQFTESSPVSTVISTDDAPSVGELIANCSAKIMNEDASAEVGPGERGELWIRGPNVMKGYWRNEPATKRTVTEDGWLMTGDICTMDTSSNFRIVDRKKVHQISSSSPSSSPSFHLDPVVNYMALGQ